MGIALGALVGLILALTGAGGGIIAVPMLIFGMGLTVTEAAPVALFAVCLSAALGTYFGLRTGHVRYRAAALMAVVGLAGAPVGWILGRHIPNGPLTLIFAAVLAYVCVRVFLLARHPANASPAALARRPCRIDQATGRLRWSPACARALGVVGFSAGVLSTLLGVGGGFVVVPALIRITDLDMQSIGVTSLAVIALISAGSIAFLGVAGHAVAWDAALPFAGGSLCGLLAGRRVARYLSGQKLQLAFGALGLCVVGILVWRTIGAAGSL